MLSDNGNENVGLFSKKQFALQHTFLNIFLPLFCKTSTEWNFQKLPIYTFYGELMSYVLLLSIVFRCRSFSSWWPLAFLISYKMFTFFFQRNYGLFGSLSLALALSVIHVNVDIKI